MRSDERLPSQASHQQWPADPQCRAAGRRAMMRPPLASTPPLEDHRRFQNRNGCLVQPAESACCSVSRYPCLEVAHRRPEYTPWFYSSPAGASAVEVEDGHVLGQVHIVEGEFHVTDSPVEGGLGQPALQPFSQGNCRAPPGGISSCKALMIKVPALRSALAGIELATSPSW
jgi:hypothetical protein